MSPVFKPRVEDAVSRPNLSLCPLISDKAPDSRSLYSCPPTQVAFFQLPSSSSEVSLDESLMLNDRPDTLMTGADH